MDVLMPQLGETVTEGKITKWFKAAGDAIKPGDNLFEIETDKVSMEVPAIAAGTLSEIRVPEGEIAAVGAVVAVIAGAGAAAAPAGPAASAAPIAAAASAAGTPVPQTPLAPAQAGVQGQAAPGRPFIADPFREVRTPERNYGPAKMPGGTRVSPLARRLAAENGIDLGGIAPSGAHGRIMARDIEAAVAKSGRSLARPAAVAAATASAAARSPDAVKAHYAPGSYEEVPLDAMRRTIATRLVEAKQTIPHFYLTIDLAVARLAEVREEANALAPKGADGAPAYKLSLNDFLIKAWALALQRVPAANAAWAEDRILRFRASDVAVAVALDGGLITPVIRNAERKSVIALAADMRDLAARARARKLRPEEYQGGATTISNLGMYGVREFSAIINPPQATILAVGAAQRRPVETGEGAMRFETMMTVTVSCDHRVVDGVLGAELLAKLKMFVEHPVGLMME